MKVYLQERPRTFVIADEEYSLIVRHPDPQYKLEKSHRPHLHAEPKNTGPNKAIVEFVRTELLNLAAFADVSPLKTGKRLQGFLGFLNAKGHTLMGFITRSTRVASPVLEKVVNRIDEVDFYCLNSNEYDEAIEAYDVLDPLQNDFEYLLSTLPASRVKRFLSLGSFYYSPNFDITTNLQERCFYRLAKSTFSTDSSYFRRFMWNSYMNSELVLFRGLLSPLEQARFDKTGFLTTITRGYAKTVNATLHNENALLTLISKQLCQKNGPLFGEWGCDDEGNVSNFVETEFIIYTERICFSYVIVRGNVPLFWELENTSRKSIIAGKTSKKIAFTRSFEASKYPFSRHFDDLSTQYGDVHVVNCLQKDTSTYKGQLNQNFQQHLQSLITEKIQKFHDEEDVTAVHFSLTATDLPLSKAHVRKLGYTLLNPSEVVQPLMDKIMAFNALCLATKTRSFIGKQLGVFRINSFDCLGKANFVSKCISQEVLVLALRDMDITPSFELKDQHAKLWQENDEALKRITNSIHPAAVKALKKQNATGVKLLKSQLTKRYMNVVGELKPSDLAMLKLLGKLQDQKPITLYNPFHHFISSELERRRAEFSTTRDIRIYCLTFNVNGVVHSDNIEEWLFPAKHPDKHDYDLVFLGLEEVVELTPGQVVGAKTTNLMLWEKHARAALERRSNHKYASHWSGQMGGIGALMFIKESQLSNIANTEFSVKKTGLGGMAANKGAVAVSLLYSSTTLCFVCCHLAAGHGNVDERHQNYKTIFKGIFFSKNRKIKDHDAVIWLGDMNFRLDLPRESVLSMVGKREFQQLYEHDQLNKQMAKGGTFPFFNEMEIAFPPTYKFDNHTSNYDTSEKQRVPAWTDRILSALRNSALKQEAYDCVDSVTFSDHRPVYAFFLVAVSVVSEADKKRIMNDINENYTNMFGDINILLTAKDVAQFVDKREDLPPPSTETEKWWLGRGMAAQVAIPELEAPDVVINPNYPKNPFEHTLEPEFLRCGLGL